MHLNRYNQRLEIIYQERHVYFSLLGVEALTFC